MEPGYLVRTLLCLLGAGLYRQAGEDKSSRLPEREWYTAMVLEACQTGQRQRIGRQSAPSRSELPNGPVSRAVNVVPTHSANLSAAEGVPGRGIAGSGGFRIVEAPLRRKRYRQGV